MMRTTSLVILAVLAACGAGSSPSTRRTNYADGTLHYEYQLKDGLPHGVGRVWHQNGELKSEGEYVNGVKHGVFRFFNEDGQFEYQALFYKGAEVWRSTDRALVPPPELVKGLVAFSGASPQLGTDEHTRAAPQAEEWSVKLSRDPPRAYFASLDRTTSLSRIGLQYGIGDASDRPQGSVTRLELFLNYKLSRLGVYGQLLLPRFESMPSMTLAGRRTAEVGGTYQVPVAEVGGLSLRTGLLVPVGNDNGDGYIAATAGSFQRPTDVAAAFPSTVAVRTGASLTRSYSRVIMQADSGIDWLLGGQSSFDALLRANAGVGLGIRSSLLTVELSNVVRVREPTRHIHAVGLGGTFWMENVWLTLFASTSFEGHVAFSGALGYEL